jgi:hypothetical protein
VTHWPLSTGSPLKFAVTLPVVVVVVDRGFAGAPAASSRVRHVGAPSGRSAVAISSRCVAICAERIPYASGLLVKWALRDPILQGRNRCHEVGHLTEPGEDVVGSHGWHAMPYNHLQYRTLLFRGAGFACRQRHDGRTAVESAQAALGHPVDLDNVGGQESRHRGIRVGRRDTRKLDHPLARLQPVRQRARSGAHDVEDVEAGWKSGIERRPDIVRFAPLGETDLQILGLARSTRRRGVGVGDTRMGAEPRGVGDGQARAAYCPLERPPEVAVAGEPEPAPFRVPDAQLLYRWRLLDGLGGHVVTIARSAAGTLRPSLAAAPTVRATNCPDNAELGSYPVTTPTTLVGPPG